jgi:histidyl-tRNA synthetase
MGNKDPFLLLSSIHPNNYLILNAYKLLTNWHPGGIYPITLAIILGVLQAAYSSAKDGYKIYNVSINDVNNLGKHLNKEIGQDDPNNRTILDILDQLGSLAGTSNIEAMEQMARQANNIRTFFFDKRKKMEDIIPQVLLVKSDYIAKEIAPEKVFLD